MPFSKESKNQPFDIIKRRYEESLDWFEGFITDPKGDRYSVVKTQEERLQDYREQIDRTKMFLDFLGNPQNQFPSIHVAGTGGKGSTSMMIGKILESTSPRVGVHTSPYLQVPGEKYLVNGKMISPSKYIETTKVLRGKYAEFKKEHPEVDLRYQEMQVAFADLCFGTSNLDFGVIETGMGGRFDPTNILDSQIAVITNINFDHVPQLGTTIPEIAWHKAGIIKPGKPVITGETKKDALDVIIAEAEKQGSKLYIRGRDYDFRIVSQDDSGIVLNVNSPYKEYRNIVLPLLGGFQAENMALALSAADILAHESNLDLSSSGINNQLEELTFPGRMEIIQKDPIVILDGAHNPQKMKALAESIEGLYPGKRYTLVCGMLSTKDSKNSLQNLMNNADKIVVTKPHVVGKPSVDPENLLKSLKEDGYQGEIVSFNDVNMAIEKTLNDAKPDDLVVITGSLYMLGEARNYWVKPEDILFKAENEYI